ncbi:hypothetical protein K443DRAFT_396958 [Laccaria amethystina LaAM-08-1]|uniref:Uncharacterized protein n=1 Tax=Laccaria amethystina LaAM-08-1 TaxID=1095629 RepID=A0A0C9XBA4_9AGAR|nr:hypothetical protein K443DRAFT_396958 [Laccaria amethystina LaAM-08-1]
MLGIRRPKFKRQNLHTIQCYHANRRADPIISSSSLVSHQCLRPPRTTTKRPRSALGTHHPQPGQE